MTDIRVVHRTLLAAVAPYSFALSVRALAGFAPCARDHHVVAAAIRKALLLPPLPGTLGADRAVVVEVAPPPDGFSGVALTVFADAPLEPAETAHVERDVSRWLGLDDDLSEVLAVAAADPAMAPVLAVAHGLHQVRFPSLAEGAVYFTLTQRSTQWFAAARKRRLVMERGAQLRLDGVDYVAFPSLATVAGLTDDELIGYGGNRQRAERLRGVVGGVAALDEEWLRTGPYRDVRDALLAVPGIGAFTAHGILLRVLGRPDDAPLELRQFELAARQVYGDPPPSPAELRERYAPWVGWWGYLTRTALGWVPDQAGAMQAPVPAAA